MTMAEGIRLPGLPGKVFCVGIGGIGVSGLAQLLVHLGYEVAGSDRGLGDVGKERLYDSLRRQGIRLFPQDGSGVREFQPDVLVISTAVEADNPDLVVDPAIPVIHRAAALSQAIGMTGAPLIAVVGSCGKTSVTGWLASALRRLGKRVVMVDGGYSLEAETDVYPGNFQMDENPEYAVVEVDESDKSLVAFKPDYSLLLNVGNDHYSQDELNDVFRDFLAATSKGVAVLEDLKGLAAGFVGGPVACFAGETRNGAVFPEGYGATADGISFSAAGFGNVVSTQSGRHSALNACAVLAMLSLLPLDVERSAMCESLAAFKGIRQRFEVVGTTPAGVYVVNDYAHNPEKIAAALSAARERFGSPLTAIFQPHGFKPLQFMREPLKEALKDVLQDGDKLYLLPVFYAGGTASFSPTSDEVAEELRSFGLCVEAKDRMQVKTVLSDGTRAGRCILVMGARDASLRTWSFELAGAKGF